MMQMPMQWLCPFRGCAGDWVKLGVAKRHGAVLGDAICLNSLLSCVLVDVVRCKMGKFSCCVRGCRNNWRNSPEKKFHPLSSDAKVRCLYEKLIRNENLKLMHNTLGFVEKECPELNFPRYFLGLRLLTSDDLLRSMKYLLRPKNFGKG